MGQNGVCDRILCRHCIWTLKHIRSRGTVYLALSVYVQSSILCGIPSGGQH